MVWRLVDSDLSDPPFTAASDEAISLARSKDMVPDTLHFYRRNRPTISLGYFQSVDTLDLNFCREHDIEIIRRASGGSAVYTDKNHLIYGFISKDILPDDMNNAYLEVCTAVLNGLEQLGVKSEYKPINDILVDGKKISGSAQMRKWGVVLQHGTIIMDIDRISMFGAIKVDAEKMKKTELDITSLKDILGHVPDLSDVKKAIVSGFESTFGTQIQRGVLTEFENTRIEELILEKYGNEKWNLSK